MELLATVDWLVEVEGAERTTAGIKKGIHNWAGRPAAGRRKLKIFDNRLISIALDQLNDANSLPA
jgi:hypothetical protein